MSTSPIRLRISRQDLENFPHFALDAQKAKEWIDELPATNAKLMVEELCKVITDLNRTPMPANVRLDILETLRGPQQTAIATLRKRFLKQPVVLPESSRQMADTTFKLLRQTITAYTTVAIEGIKHKATLIEANPAKLVCLALHRAITTAGLKLLHTFQLYQPVELQAWLEINQLYLLAERQKLQHIDVEDKIYGDGTILHTFMRALLLTCSKPNQLRQADMAAVFRGLRDWAPLCELTVARQADGLFLVDLASDHPPIYSALHHGRSSDSERSLSTRNLVETLEELQQQDLRDGRPGIVFDADTTLPSGILNHLITAYGVMSQRSFSRNKTSNQLLVSLGLGSAHYHLLDGESFNELVTGVADDADEKANIIDNNPFIRAPVDERKDPWALTESRTRIDNEGGVNLDDVNIQDAYFNLIKTDTKALSEEERHPVFAVDILNVSPGGYCLQWTESLPGNINAGDIICLRESEEKPWVIAVIRWVSAQNHGNTLVGVELLSPRAVPYAAKTHRKTGPEGEMMRVLLLPEIKLVGQPDTLITPRAGFKERQKVTLVKDGEEQYIQLNRQLTATAAFAQYDFKTIKHLEEVASDNFSPTDSEFESVWTQI